MIQKKRNNRLLYIIAITMAIASVGMIVRDINYFGKMSNADTKCCYAAALMMRQHLDPYNDSGMQHFWIKTFHNEPSAGPPPGDRNSEFVYLPQASCFFMPLSYFRWPIARYIFTILISIADIIFLWMLISYFLKELPLTLKLVLFAVLLQIAPLYNILFQGQWTTIAIAFAFGGWILEKQKHPILAALAMVFSTVKFTLTIPILAFWFWKRKYRTLGLSLALIFLITILCAAPSGIIPTLLNMKQELKKCTAFGAVNDTSTANPDQIHIITFGSLTHRLFDKIHWPSELLSDIMIVISIGALLLIVPRIEENYEGLELAAFNICGLLTVYHRSYDLVILPICTIPLIHLFINSYPRIRRFAIIQLFGLFLLMYVLTSWHFIDFAGRYWNVTPATIFLLIKLVLVFCFVQLLYLMRRASKSMTANNLPSEVNLSHSLSQI